VQHRSTSGLQRPSWRHPVPNWISPVSQFVDKDVPHTGSRRGRLLPVCLRKTFTNVVAQSRRCRIGAVPGVDCGVSVNFHSPTYSKSIPSVILGEAKDRKCLPDRSLMCPTPKINRTTLRQMLPITETGPPYIEPSEKSTAGLLQPRWKRPESTSPTSNIGDSPENTSASP